MAPRGKFILEGMSIEELLGHFEKIIDLKVKEIISKNNPLHGLPNQVPAKDAARVLGYKTTASLKQYHGIDLTPIREKKHGRFVFYDKAELTKLYNRKFFYH
jgi:hypothetical protein